MVAKLYRKKAIKAPIMETQTIVAPYFSNCQKKTPNPKHAIIPIEAAKPSIPSMRFTAFVTLTNTNIENRIENQYGISKIPKTP